MVGESMSDRSGAVLARVQIWSQVLAMALVAGGALAGVVSTKLAAAGVLPWMELPVRFGSFEPAFAGAAFQVGLTVILLLLCAFLPSAIRVMRLEATHREFALRMEDVARAYWVAHAADRTGVFKLQREYDAVRERLRFLRKHPDLEDLDHDLLEVAAQMGNESRELAQIYSDERVARAKEHLSIRQHEAELLSHRIAKAHAATAELRRMMEAVQMDEAMVRSRIARLREELAEIVPPEVPDLGNRPEERRRRLGVVPGT